MGKHIHDSLWIFLRTVYLLLETTGCTYILLVVLKLFIASCKCKSCTTRLSNLCQFDGGRGLGKSSREIKKGKAPVEKKKKTDEKE